MPNQYYEPTVEDQNEMACAYTIQDFIRDPSMMVKVLSWSTSQETLNKIQRMLTEASYNRTPRML